MPANRPGPRGPSRRANFTPRREPISKGTGKAAIERIVACNIGGTSGSTSLTATWLNPQLRQSISISATAPGLSARPTDFNSWFEGMIPRDPAWRRVLLVALLAVRANAGDFDHRQFRRKAGGPRRSVEALRHRSCRNFADRTAGVADQKRHHGGGVMVVGAGEIGIAALDAMDEAVLHQEIERAIDRDRRRPRHRFGEFVDHFIGAERPVAGQ